MGNLKVDSYVTDTEGKRKGFKSIEDIEKREKLNKELVRLYILIASKDHEFQRLLDEEEPGHNENI